MPFDSRLTVDTVRSKHLAISRIGRTGSQPARDFLALTQREREERTPPYCRNNPTVTRHQARMDECSLPKARPISCNGLPAFQRRHTSLFCAAESPTFSLAS